MQSEEALKKLFGELPYKTLVKEIKDFSIFHLDSEGHILSWNEGARQTFGYAEDEIINQHFSILFTSEDKQRDVPNLELKKAKTEGQAEDVRWHIRKNGSLFFAVGVTTPLHDESGRLLGYAKIARDSTARKQIEEALEKSNRRVSNVLESITDAFFALDNAWRFSYLNKQAELLLQRPSEELLGKNIWEEFPGAINSAFGEQYHKAVAEQVTVTFNDFYVPLDTWFEVRAYPSREGLSVYFHNINERKQAEKLMLEQTRLANLTGDIGQALIQDDKLRNILTACAGTLVQHLDAAFARIWTLNKDENVLELRASAGMYTHLDGEHSRVPVGKYKIGLIARERVPHLTNDVQNDSRVSDKNWAKNEQITAFAGYPLIVEDQLVGVMCVFARHSLTDITLDAMASISNGIANAIERKQTEEAFRESEERYRTVAETASDAIISIDEKSTILFINRAATRIFGYEVEEMIGQSLTMLMPDYLRHVHEAGFERYMETGKRHLDWERVEVPGLHRDGHEFPLELSFGELKKNNRHVFIGIARDISERKQVENERERLLESEQAARTQAEEANHLKDEFLATLSHELRTPLNAILGWSQMLQSREMSEAETEKALKTIERNARSQNQLIDDLLDVSRIITGKLRLDVRAVDLTDVITAAVDAARPAAELKGIRLQTLIDPQATPISGDPDRLQQIVWNLLSNAVKFTPKGGRVQVRAERVNSHVEIVVSDTGRGIEREFLAHVFDRFRQSDGSSSRRHGGLGLGLAIAQQLVELHGGTISVQSAGEGQGSTFTVCLPLLPVRSDPASEKPRVHPAAQTIISADCPPELDGLRVLVVDDEADSRELLNAVLSSCGAQITAASSAAEAFELVQNERFDVIISDIGMPDEDGYSLIKRIRELPAERGGGLPAVALTAYARSEDRIKALRANFQMHIPKPVEPPELIVVVANLAGRTDNPKME
jgi:PAS domain S-box-containing protein